MTKLYTLLALSLISAPAFTQPGALDATFDPLAGPNDWVYCMVEQPDGKVIIGGDFTSYNGVPRNRIARINADGTLDATFDPGQGASGTVTSIALQPDGKLVVGGWFTTFNSVASSRLVRLNANGSIDYSFSVGTGFNSNVETILLMDDGSVVVGGAFWAYNGNALNRLAKLDPNGQLDVGFAGSIGSAANQAVKHLALLPDGRVVVAGEFTNWNSWTVGGMVVLWPTGGLSTFDVGTGANGAIRTVLPLPEGGVLVGGDFTSWNGVPRSRLVRLGSNGALDLNWGPGLGASSTVRHLSRQADGRIIVAGSFTNIFGVDRTRIARLIPTNGAVETAFDPGNGPNLDVECALLAGGDRILIGGNFSSYDGTPRVRLARIKACLPTPVSIDGITLTASEPNGPYQWIDCATGQPIAGATGQSFTPTANGSYAVTTASNGCIITSDCIAVTTVGIDNPAEVPIFRAWPLPCDGRLWLEVEEAGVLEVMVGNGQLLRSQRIAPGTHAVDVTGPASMVVLRLVSSQGVRTLRVPLVP